ncbi:TIGR00180 family glycosyltransferase [Vibrio penaeicida]|uniref:TIGR00180 family glycosyltransferase n=1 Tax=Vibrio penaeicida TaxID=104609 RepID=UPI000CEA3208|nr:TIGR00180 family glycosyltransferase [Vibrio penaeicida]
MKKQHKLSIIIPTHNRHDNIQNSVRFYSNFSTEIRILYLDSSPNSLELELDADNIEYIHLPGLSFIEKLNVAIGMISTNNAMLCPDDDFAFERSIELAMCHMAEKKVSMVSGRIMGFNKGSAYKLDDLYCLDDGKKFRESIYRDHEFFHHYHQILWSLYDVAVLKSIVNNLLSIRLDNDNFLEMVFAAHAIDQHGISLINRPWLVREVSNVGHWGQRHKPLAQCAPVELEQDLRALSTIFTNDLFMNCFSSYVSSQNKKAKIYNRFLYKLYRVLDDRKMKQSFSSCAEINKIFEIISR